MFICCYYVQFINLVSINLNLPFFCIVCLELAFAMIYWLWMCFKFAAIGLYLCYDSFWYYKKGEKAYFQTKMFKKFKNSCKLLNFNLEIVLVLKKGFVISKRGRLLHLQWSLCFDYDKTKLKAYTNDFQNKTTFKTCKNSFLVMSISICKLYISIYT